MRLALLPHSSPAWQEEALGGEPCGDLASALLAKRTAQPARMLAESYADARKRLWLRLDTNNNHLKSHKSLRGLFHICLFIQLMYYSFLL